MSFGALPTFADLSPDQQAALMQRLQAQYGPGDQQANPPAAGLPGGLLGQVDPQTTGAIPGQGGAPQVAMNEADTRRLEEQMGMRLPSGGQQPAPDLARLFDPAAMGGAPAGFSGSSGAVIPQADAMGARLVPMPPGRPSDDALAYPQATGGVSGMNPAGPVQRQTVAASKAVPGPAPNQYLPATPADRDTERAGGRPLAGDFDPLTGQPISGQPRALGAPQGVVSPSGAAAATAASGQGQQPGIMDRFIAGMNSPDGSNFLRSLAIGLLTKRGIGPGIGAGLENYQTSQAGSLKQQLQQIQLMQQQQTQNALRQAFAGKGLPPAMVEAAALDPTVRSSVLAQINRQPQQIDFNGERYMGVPGTDPSTWQHLGSAGAPLDQEVKKADALASVADAHKDDTIRYITDPNTKQQYPFNESAYLRAQAASASGTAGTGTGTKAATGSDAAPLGPPITSKGPTPAEESEQRVIGDARGKILSSAIEAGDPARKRIAVTDQMAAALNQAAPNMTTGPLSGSIMTAKEALAGVLGRPIEGLSGQEMLNSMGPILAGEAAKGITSRPALAEFKAIANVKPGQQFSVEGNRALLDVIRQNAQREADLSDLAATSKDAGEFAQKREGYLRDNPLINPFTQKPFGSASGAGPGMSLGANGSGGSAGDPSARFQQLVDSGMSKADAYAQMHKEGL